MNNKYIGSTFDDFLEKEGLFADVESIAMTRVITFQISQLMNEHKLSKAALSKQKKTSRSSIDEQFCFLQLLNSGIIIIYLLRIKM